MSFRSVFIAVVIGFGLIVGAFLVNRARPRVETDQPSAAFVRATGKCAECHTPAAVLGRPRVRAEPCTRRRASTASTAISRPTAQEKQDHHGFAIVDEADGRQLPQLPRADLPAVPAQPPRRAVVGGGLRRGRG